MCLFSQFYTRKYGMCLRYGTGAKAPVQHRGGGGTHIYFGYLLHSDTEIQIDTH